MSDSPSAQRGAGRTFPERIEDPPSCSRPGLGTPAKKVCRTGKRGTGAEPVEKVQFLSHAHACRSLDSGHLAQVFAVLPCPHPRPGAGNPLS